MPSPQQRLLISPGPTCLCGFGQPLGWLEAVAAILFLIPATGRAGGYGLLLTFAAAVRLHIHLGDYGVGALIVYAAAVIVCMADCGSQMGHKTA